MFENPLAGLAAEASIRHTAGSDVPTPLRFAKPEKRAVLRDAKSMVLTVAVFSFVFLCVAAVIRVNDWLLQFSDWMALLILFAIAISVNLVLFSVAYAARRFLPKRPEYPDEFGRLELIGAEVVQFDESTAMRLSVESVIQPDSQLARWSSTTSFSSRGPSLSFWSSKS